MDPGVYYDLPEHEYHSDPCDSPSLSASIAQTIVLESPAHAWLQHPRFGGKQIEPTKEMDRGTLVHALLLGKGRAIEAYLRGTTAAGLTVAGYGAASRTSALLRSAHIEKEQVVVVADASTAKHGRTMPGNRIPIVSPADLVALAPDRVLLFVPDLLAEVRAALPQIEANGGRWVVLDPMPREVEPLARA